uniref:Uncharacterized protein n=1 Tax=Anopheles albimanus TaxID=7167 RepID=A0A182FZ90_ANOAL
MRRATVLCRAVRCRESSNLAPSS